MAKVCIYHGTDLDGKCSAAIIKRRHPECVLIPMNYDDPFECDGKINPGDEVFIVDFVLQPFDRMIKCNTQCNLTWIDHHDTAIDDYTRSVKNGAKEIKGCRDTKKAACELVWEYMFPNIPVPYSVWLLSRFDIWEHNQSSSILPFQFGMLLNHREPNSEQYWDSVFTADRDGDLIHDTIHDGKIIIKYRDKLNSKLCEVQTFESTILNRPCICINRALCGSTVFDSVWDPEKYDVMVVFYICGRGAWNVSLYTEKEDVHVGEIARYYGGGGHAGAAGFRCTILPFDIAE